MEDAEFREELLDVHGFILSQPIFCKTSYKLFEDLTEQPCFVDFVTTFKQYFQLYNKYLQEEEEYNDPDQRAENKVFTSESIDEVKKECENVLDKLCELYSTILLRDINFESVTIETEVFEGVYQFITELARKSKEINKKYLSKIIKQIGFVIRSEKFNKEAVIENQINDKNNNHSQFGKPPFIITDNGLQKYKDKDMEELDELFKNKYTVISDKRVGVTPYDAKKVENLRVKQYIY